MRINKFIAESGYCSRRKAEDFIKNSKVFVNNKVLKDFSYQVKKNDIIRINGEKIEIENRKIYIAMNKPAGYTCTVKDNYAEKKIIDLIDSDTRLYPVGRLDKASRGLIILTNDGRFTYELTHPKFYHKKIYEVTVQGRPKKEEILKISNGIIIDNYKLKKSIIKFMNNIDNNAKYLVTIFEGRNRQIRKMFESINHPVIDLKRVQIGNYRMPKKLKEGKYTYLTSNELNLIRGCDDRS